jgi:hypothetical protein
MTSLIPESIFTWVSLVGTLLPPRDPNDDDDEEEEDDDHEAATPRLCGAGAMQSSWLLARLQKRALPARALLPHAAALLLGSQARNAAGALGQSRNAVQAHSRAPSHRLAQRLGGLVVVLTLLSLPDIARRRRA